MDNLDKNKEVPNKDNPQKLDEITKERYKQAMEGSRAEVERWKGLAKEVARVSSNPDVLKDIHKKDAELANEISTIVFDKPYTESLENLQQKQTGSYSVDDLDKWYQQKKAEEQHGKSLETANSVFSKIKDDNRREEAKSRFDQLSEGRNLTPEQAREYAEMSVLYVSKEDMSKDNYASILGTFASGSVGNSKPQSDGDDTIVWNGKVVKKSSLLSNNNNG